MNRVREREREREGETWWRLRALVEIAVRTAQTSGSENWRGWEAILEATERMWSLELDDDDDDVPFLLTLGFGGEAEAEGEPDFGAPIGVACLLSSTTVPILTF